MAHKFVGEYRGVVENLNDIDGEGRDLSEHHPPQRVGRFKVEVLHDKVGALAVGLDMAVSAKSSPRLWRATKRAVYLEEAHVY